MACHFIKALNIPSHLQAKQKIADEADDGFDVAMNMDIEASPDDSEALQEASLTDFEAGEVVGKLMAFVAQLWLCGEDTRDYLKMLAASHGCPSWEIKLWIRTHWGSLSDCFRVVLTQQKVCIIMMLNVVTHT